MKYVAAYALLVLGGKAEPTSADLEKVLKEAGIKADSAHSDRLIAALKGKNLTQIMAAGKAKMSSLASAAPSGAAPAKAAEKKVEKVEEKPKEEEVDMAMGDLFGGDY
jgi:large subunit ribosomal protein LP2